MAEDKGSERLYNPTDFERKLLVFYKKFPSIELMPNRVSLATVERVKNRARVQFNLLMVGVFSCAFLYTAIQGKRAARAGHDIAKQNRDWHNEYNDPANVDRKIPEIRREK